MRRRRAITVLIIGTILLAFVAAAPPELLRETFKQNNHPIAVEKTVASTREALEGLEVKGRAAKTGYARAQFGDGWLKVNGCSTRDIILFRDLQNTIVDDRCKVQSGELHDVYTGGIIQFSRSSSDKVQIDHIVALSNAWQTGAQQLTKQQRVQLANDPLELIAVLGSENQLKGDGDAATWLPKNKSFRCEYIARQIQIKKKYSLWVTPAEKKAMVKVLNGCGSI